MRVLFLALLLAAGSAAAQPIRIGELNSYKVFPAFLEPYKKGFELALEEINAKGGVNGRKLEIVSRDDGGTPGDAVRVAEELISRDKADVLMGTFASNVGLAVANLAAQRKIVFLAAEPLTDKIVWENGNAYTFRLRPSTYMQVAMLVPEAAKLKKKRWAIVYPNYEYGQSATDSFKKLLKAAQPDVEFVAEQASPLGKIEAGAVVQALADAKPDAIFSALFAADLQKFVREGNTRGLFANRSVFNLLGGEPEYLDPLKDETPEGWWVTAIRGASSRRRSTCASARRTRSAGTTTRASARLSDTPPSMPLPKDCARRAPRIRRKFPRPWPGWRWRARSVASRGGRSTISPRWVPMWGSSRRRMAVA